MVASIQAILFLTNMAPMVASIQANHPLINIALHPQKYILLKISGSI